MRDVFVIPPRECLEGSFYWHLNVATYGLTNANAKWQVHSDNTLLRIGLSGAVYIPQLFYLKVDGVLALIAAEIVDDILVGRREDLRLKLISQLCEAYDVGTIVHLPGTINFLA